MRAVRRRGMLEVVRFAIEQGLRQRCVLTAPLFSIFFAAVRNVAYTRFKADIDIRDALLHIN